MREMKLLQIQNTFLLCHIPSWEAYRGEVSYSIELQSCEKESSLSRIHRESGMCECTTIAILYCCMSFAPSG